MAGQVSVVCAGCHQSIAPGSLTVTFGSPTDAHPPDVTHALIECQRLRNNRVATL